MSLWLAISIVVLAWFGLILLSWWLCAVPIRRGDLEAAILIRTIQVYARVVHRLRVEGVENIPERATGRTAGGSRARESRAAKEEGDTARESRATKEEGDTARESRATKEEGDTARESRATKEEGDTARESRATGERCETGSGALIVAANHTAGVDPILIQSALPFEPRWMMAEDMREPRLDALWEFAEIIFVDRRNGDPGSLRKALRHLKGGGVIGVFPEGFIERPARHLLPFRPGVGLLIRRARAPVLPIVIEGTPEAPTAMGSYFRASRARLRILPMVHYEDTEMGAEEIAVDLRRRFAEATGWPDAPAPEARGA